MEAKWLEKDNFFYTLRKEFTKKEVDKAIDEYQYIKHFARIGTLVGGWINDIKDNAISVALDSLDAMYINRLSGKYGICPLRYQPKPERGKYRRGDYHFFYVKLIKIVKNSSKNKLDIEITLSRTNIKLPVLLMLYYPSLETKTETNIPEKIVCIQRQAGFFSKIETNGRIPKQCIEYVSDEFAGEKIYIQRRKKKKPQVKKPVEPKKKILTKTSKNPHFKEIENIAYRYLK